MSSRISWSDRLRNRESTGKTGVCSQRSRCVSDPSVTGGRAPSLRARCSSRISCSEKANRSTAASISVSALIRGNLANKTSSLCLLNLISTSIPAETLSSQPWSCAGIYDAQVDLLPKNCTYKSFETLEVENKLIAYLFNRHLLIPQEFFPAAQESGRSWRTPRVNWRCHMQ